MFDSFLYLPMDQHWGKHSQNNKEGTFLRLFGLLFIWTVIVYKGR